MKPGVGFVHKEHRMKPVLQFVHRGHGIKHGVGFVHRGHEIKPVLEFVHRGDGIKPGVGFVYEACFHDRCSFNPVPSPKLSSSLRCTTNHEQWITMSMRAEL